MEYLAIVWRQSIYGEEFFGMVANLSPVRRALRNSIIFLRCTGFSVLFGEIFYKHMYIKRKEQAFMSSYSKKLVLPFVNKLANS